VSIPLIGIVPLWDEQKDSLWMLPGYMDCVKQAGGLPVMLPLTSDMSLITKISRTVDGVLFAGGQDISPDLYGHRDSGLCGEICKERDDMEPVLFSEAVLGLDTPAFGICRGLQFINAVLGGTLYQDLPSQLNGTISVDHKQKTPMTETCHTVFISADTPLHEFFATDKEEVNSGHHQGVCELSDKLSAMAVAEDGLIEAAYMPDKAFVWAVQWHPECTPHEERSRKLFGAFVEAAVKRMHKG